MKVLPFVWSDDRGRGLRRTGRLTAEAALLLSAAILRWPGVWHNRFHADEALFATWSKLVYFGDDFLLAGQAVDKPPLLFYLQAGLYPLLGTTDAWVARLPGLAASLHGEHMDLGGDFWDPRSDIFG